MYDDLKNNITNAKPIDIISKLKSELESDPLYKIMLRSDKYNNIFPPEVIDNLEEWRVYSTKDIESLIGINMATTNHWLKVLNDYIQPVKVDKYNKISPIGLIKLRMVQILRENISLGEIKNLVLPEVFDSEENNSRESINELVHNLEHKVEKLTQQNEAFYNIIMNLIDPDNFENNKTIALNPNLFTPLLESAETRDKTFNDKIEEIQNAVDKNNIKLEDKLNKLEEENKQLKEWTSMSKEEIKKLSKEMQPWWKKIFNK
jgi:DNA-binding transcriptional MerR regulator